MVHTVLIVDDSLTVRMDLAESFHDGGFDTTACGTGAEARAALAAGPHDVAILDVMLPDADGVDLLREIRAAPEHADTVVLMLSSEAEVSDRVRGLRTGAHEYVGKPYDAGYVVARTRQLLRLRDAPTQERATVLVIDDSLTYREHLRQALEKERYAVLTAANGEEGLRLAADRRPSAIVVDGVMPGIDGATVIRQVRLDVALRDTPCLLLTAADDDATALQTLAAGADAVVHKHEDLSIILARLATALRQRPDRLPIQAVGSMHGPTKILLVDTDRARLRAAGDALRVDGHESVLAHTAQDALSLLAVQPVDCVVVDLDVPGLVSGDLPARARALPDRRDLPIVAVGDRADTEVLVKCLAAGADHYIRRSDGLDLLRANVRSQIRRKQSEAKARRIREELLRGEIEAAEARAAKELAEARAVLVRELEWRNEELDAFAGSVTHDLRSPLQAIRGLAEILIDDDMAALSPQGQHRLQRIMSAAVRMSDLVDSLLLLSRASRSELRWQPTDLSALAREVGEELRDREPHRSVDLAVQDGLLAEGDPGMLRVVLANLMGNAWKFTGKTEKARIDVEGAVSGNEVVCAVRDNGVGFPAADAERIFRPFQRVHGTTDFPGTGIGLTTVHRIVDRHGGRIGAESDVGRGSVFTFTLPRCQAGSGDPRADAEPAVGA